MLTRRMMLRYNFMGAEPRKNLLVKEENRASGFVLHARPVVPGYNEALSLDREGLGC